MRRRTKFGWNWPGWAERRNSAGWRVSDRDIEKGSRAWVPAIFAVVTVLTMIRGAAWEAGGFGLVTAMTLGAVGYFRGMRHERRLNVVVYPDAEPPVLVDLSARQRGERE